MSSADASRGAPVRIRGSVTALSGWKNSFFLQDASGGISVDRTDAVEVHAGDEVEVTNHVQVLGRKTLPPAPPSVFADLAGGKQDGQRIELQGVVYSANVSESWGRPVLIVMDATVRMRGVYGTAFNEKRQFQGDRLFVPSIDDVQVDQTAPADSFAIPASTIQSLLRFGSAQGLSHRVRVSGILIGQRLGHTLYLQSGSEGIVVGTAGVCILDVDEVQQPRSFIIMLRSACDVAVLRKPQLTLAQFYGSPEVWCS